jgi:hypothetical protein
MASKRTDRELLRQLDDARQSGQPVAAVVRLRHLAGTAPDPAVVERQTQTALERTAETTGEQPDDVHVMGRLSVAYVSGSERFMRELVEQPEVASAVANQTGSADADSAAPDTAIGNAL